MKCWRSNEDVMPAILPPFCSAYHSYIVIEGSLVATKRCSGSKRRNIGKKTYVYNETVNEKKATTGKNKEKQMNERTAEEAT